MATLNAERIKEKKQEKRKRIIIITLIEMLLAIWITSLISQLLEILLTGNFVENGIELNVNYGFAIMQLVKVRINQALYVTLEIAHVVFLILLENPYSEKIEKVDTFFITPDIEKPVPAGNGQHGNARLLRADEKEKLYKKMEWTGNWDKLELEKGGIVLNYRKEGDKEIIYYLKGDIHTLIRAATGMGKTRRIFFETMAMQILSGISIVASDVKGELYYYTSPFARERGYNIYDFDLKNPEKSIHYNYMQPILDELKRGDEAKAIDYTWDLVSVLVGEQKGEAIWYNGECASIAATILILAIEAPEEYRNLTNAYFFLAFMCQQDEYGEMPINRYMKQLEDTHPAKAVFIMATIAADRTRSSFYTSALGTLRLFTNPSIAEMTSKSDFRLEDIAREKSILYMMVPDDKDTYYPLVSLLITQLYSAFMKLADQNGGRVPVPVDMDLDELGNFPKIPALGAMTAAGRSRGVRVNIIIQDDQQMEKTYEKDFKNILTNCKNKIFLGGDDPDTLKRISEQMGTYTAETNSASSSTSGKTAGMDNNVSLSTSSQLTGVKLLDTQDLQLIKPPYALCQMTGERSAVNILPDLSQYYFNEMFGLGDEEHNRKIIMEREAERKSRKIPKINLWGIWKEYQEPEEDEYEEYEEPEESKKTEKISFLH